MAILHLNAQSVKRNLIENYPTTKNGMLNQINNHSVQDDVFLLTPLKKDLLQGLNLKYG